MSFKTIGTLVTSIGSTLYNGYDTHDSYQQRSTLQAQAEKLERDAEKLGDLEPGVQDVLKSTSDKLSETASMRMKGAFSNICAGICNIGSSVLNTVVSGFEVVNEGVAPDLLSSQAILGVIAYSASGTSDLINGSLQAKASYDASKEAQKASCPEEREIHQKHASNQRNQAIASSVRSAGAFTAIGTGNVGVYLAGAGAATLISAGSNWWYKPQITKIADENPSKVDVQKAAMFHKGVLSQDDMMQDEMVNLAAVVMVSSPTTTPLVSSTTETPPNSPSYQSDITHKTEVATPIKEESEADEVMPHLEPEDVVQELDAEEQISAPPVKDSRDCRTCAFPI